MKVAAPSSSQMSRQRATNTFVTEPLVGELVHHGRHPVLAVEQGVRRTGLVLHAKPGLSPVVTPPVAENG